MNPVQARRVSGLPRASLVACLSALLGLTACGADAVNGHVVYPDGSAWGDGGQVFDPSGDGAGADATTQTGDGAVAQPGADGHAAADAVKSPWELRFAMPGGNKDDFGGICNELCALQMHQNGLRNLYVGLFKDGVPVENDEIAFSFGKQTDTSLGHLYVTNALTDEKGVAGSQLKSLNQLGVFDVVASAPSHPGAKPIAFRIHVISKAKGPLTLTMTYKGIVNPLTLTSNKFRLSLQANGHPKCADIDLGTSQLPKAPWESPPNMLLGKKWAITYPSFVNWVKTEQAKNGGAPLSFTVIALGAKSAIGKPLVGGCVDTGATVSYNAQTQAIEGDDVIVDMSDIPPRIAGTYDMTTYMDLLSILPDPVEMVLKTVFDIMTDPVGGTLALVCKLGGGSLDSFCGLIFDDPKKPSIKNLKSPFGELVVKVLNVVLLTTLPKDVKTALDTGADLGAILTNLELSGVIQIDKEPDKKGFLSKDYTKDQIHSVTYKWSLGQGCNAQDPNCGKKTFSINQFQQDAIVGHFDMWRDHILRRVKFAKHGLNIKWGALVNFIIQKQLLPLMTNPKNDPTQPVIDSWAKLIKSLLADKKCLFKDTCCEDFAKNLEKQQSLVKAPFLTGVCESLIKLGTAMLDAQIAKLNVDTSKGDSLTLYTDKCPIFDFNGDMHVDGIGSVVEMCSWNMTLKIGGSLQKLDAKFLANRQQ